MTDLDIIILAAGKGTRMHSALPKVLHLLAGRPLLAHVLATAMTLAPRSINLVLGHQSEQIQTIFSDYPCQFITQTEQLGTGHAILQVLPHLPQQGRTLILSADVPLITVATLHTLLNSTPPDTIGLITAIVENPKGLGRVQRDTHGVFSDIIEETETTPLQKLINEINAGIYLFPNAVLHQYLPKITNHNAKQEYYLPSVLPLAQPHAAIATYLIPDPDEIFGINDRTQLMQAQKILQKRAITELLEAGVTIMDADRVDIRGFVSAELDVMIDVNVVLTGEITIGANTSIGPSTIISHSRIGKNVTIKSHCVIDNAIIGDNCTIGPFAHIRPGTTLASDVKIGNFVELKQTQLGSNTKVNHLSYIGDAEIGKNVNIGAGTITCNYNGVEKYPTKIGDDAFIGSNTALVAPLTVGAAAVIGAGSVITRNAPAGELTLTRSEQKTLGRWPLQKK